MISDINNILLIKYLRNELNEQESKQLLSWLQENEENKDFLFGLKEAYTLSRWKELQVRSDTAQEWQKLNAVMEEATRTKRPKRLMSFVRYAAVAIFVFGLGFFLRDVGQKEDLSYNMVETSLGESSTLILNDGTKVKLNENSKLIYPSCFEKDSRRVKLKGEAYFEAAHNEKRPFFVNVGAYTVKVLGTKFNVDAYPDQLYVYTSLKEGKVQIIENSEDSKIISELKPGNQFSYNKRSGEFFVKSVDMDEIGDWTNGEVVLKRETLEDVVGRLEQKYGYTFDIQNKSLNRLTYNITIENESLEEILSNIHFITPQVHYTIHKEKKTVILK